MIKNPINSKNLAIKINEQLNGFMLKISNKLINFTNTITKKMDEMKADLETRIGKEKVKNNVQVSFFFLDLIKFVAFFLILSQPLIRFGIMA